MATLLKKFPASMSRRAGWLDPSHARLPLLLAIALIADGCATSGWQPGTMAYRPYRERAETQVQGELSVTVALPTAAEAAAIYGVDLAQKQIQPVWIEVRNDATLPYWFLISGLDPNYFAASEAAHAFHATTADGADRVLDERFDSLQFRNPIMPGATVSGSVLTDLDEGVKGRGHRSDRQGATPGASPSSRSRRVINGYVLPVSPGFHASLPRATPAVASRGSPRRATR